MINQTNLIISIVLLASGGTTNRVTAEDWTTKLLLPGEIKEWDGCDAELEIKKGRLSQFAPDDYEKLFPENDLKITLNQSEVNLFLKGLVIPPPLRFATHPKLQAGSGGGGFSVGHMKLTKQNRNLNVELGFDCFLLTEQSIGYESDMYSSYIAEFLDDIVFQKTKQHLPQRYKKRLSGEYVIERMKNEYLRQKQLSKRGELED